MNKWLDRTAIAVSNISKGLAGRIIKPPRLQECKTEVLFCLVAQEAPALLRQLMDQTVNTSNSAMLECQVRGIPEPQITWLKNHEEIHQESGESSVCLPTLYRLFVVPCVLSVTICTPKCQPSRSCRHVRPLWSQREKYRYKYLILHFRSHLQIILFLFIYYRGSLKTRCLGQSTDRQENTRLEWGVYEYQGKSLARHAKFVLDSQPNCQANSISAVPKIEMCLPEPGESMFHAAENNSLPGGMLLLQEKNWEMFSAVSKLASNISLGYMSSSNMETFFGDFRWKWMMGGKRKTFLIQIHAHSNQEHTMRSCYVLSKNGSGGLVCRNLNPV